MFAQPSSIFYLRNKKKGRLYSALKTLMLSACLTLKPKKLLKISDGLGLLTTKAPTLVARMNHITNHNELIYMNNSAPPLKKKKLSIVVFALKKNSKKNAYGSKHLNYLHAMTVPVCYYH